MILQGFKLFPRDRIETTDTIYRLIPTLPIVVELVGGIGQSVGCTALEISKLMKEFRKISVEAAK